ncbi:hypothetical protein GCM10027413_01080 [Conyzicola nivalis]|uniref:Uncharacterized protein n=1 Tax=Conyzicola nivalis TaxID=1477021 RepID=A0A916WKW8_9MICO|nr:SAV_915 family protein [Conyzicola nivalis]GGB09830.1 hypothetical protein GCM10010979_25560 [Conyzicola nivalis]
MTDAPVILPPMLYLPVLEHPEGGDYAAVLELSDKRMGLLAYTALDRLADKCGVNQSWIVMSTSQLGRIKEAQPYDVVLFDFDVPASMRSGERIA